MFIVHNEMLPWWHLNVRSNWCKKTISNMCNLLSGPKRLRTSYLNPCFNVNTNTSNVKWMHRWVRVDGCRRSAVHALHVGVDRRTEGSSSYDGRLHGLCRNHLQVHLRLPGERRLLVHSWHRFVQQVLNCSLSRSLLAVESIKDL